MELRHLRYFVQIAELEHFGQASQRLNVVQPALSRQIKQLEEELGVNLFERVARGVKLTAAGKVFLSQSKELLSQCDKMVRLTQLVNQGQAGLLRIGFADGVTFNKIFSQILKDFRHTNANVVIDLVSATSIEQAELLSRGELDLGFVYWLPKEQQVNAIDLGSERLVLAIPKSSPLAAKKKLTIVDLDNYPMVWIARSNSPSLYDLIVSRFVQNNCTLNVVQEARNESTLLSLVSAEIGATFITETAKTRKPDDITLIQVTDLNAFISVKAIWNSQSNPILPKFVTTIQQTVTTCQNDENQH